MPRHISPISIRERESGINLEGPQKKKDVTSIRNPNESLSLFETFLTECTNSPVIAYEIEVKVNTAPILMTSRL